MTADWHAPIPIDDFVALNTQQVKAAVPEICPKPETIGGIEVACGPILRLCGTLENGTDSYRASVLLVTQGGKPSITYQIGAASADVEAENVQDGEFPGMPFYETKGGLEFWRFNVNLTLAAYEQRVRYSVNGVSKEAYQFFIPAVDESMNVMSFSCNGFSLATDTSSFKLSLWLDVLRKHSTTQHYHVMLGGGDQIYNDSIKMHCQTLDPWLNLHTAHLKRDVRATPEMLEDFESFYLKSYLEWFGHGYWRGKIGGTLQSMFPLTMAQIPSVNIYDDHDIIDGFGSYKDRTMALDVFSSIGNVAYKYYMLFQHHMAPDSPEHIDDPSWILSKKDGMFIKQKSHSCFMRLGREISLLGVDCRTERRLTEIVSPSTYDIIFLRIQAEIEKSPETKHLLVMLGVPILYPRLVWLEKMLTSRLLKPIRGLATRGVMAQGLVNEFDGSVEVLDDLNDHWCSHNHKAERNKLIKLLTEFGAKNGVRVTILSGDVHLCCFGRMKTKIHHHPHAHVLSSEDKEAHNRDVTKNPQHDPRLIFNVISSAIINAPPPDAMASLLNKTSKVHHYDKYTDEDVIPLFTSNPDGSERENHQFLNKRNWSDLVMVKQSPLYKGKTGESKFPSPLFEKDISAMAQKPIDDRYIKYPIFNESLVATLHVEADGNDPEASTASYEVMIPDLHGKFELESTSIKHVH
ncbi:hypothetical protein METBIDRAFT_33530 [Metschnikowia bicuspidata var. bicuspidata NRRL YB-4993]|uniref:PhoD-like phosphatase domain-containing protein n=1 Tax=Metschnikowia bicuspidata var. bicuspidata NRRL YB-4993 TaxID=869754 RepID=A0A1A0H5I1_9ASCO|nr:hypothetical protein METBIDRAFT_33530 [Metschnikowia bicuspidata var. bicuspidata NRRL YB-4993]OBA19349.1 hypothetical protein METBIDRAFT_33530 [Metschnikowia bicuspidata var. bicuspidata NRRL YB-4993]